MMSDMPLETCWDFNKRWNNKFNYGVHLVVYFYRFILRCTDPWILNNKKKNSCYKLFSSTPTNCCEQTVAVCLGLNCCEQTVAVCLGLNLRNVLIIHIIYIHFRTCNSNLFKYVEATFWELYKKDGTRPLTCLRSWVRIPPGAWMFVCCECRMLSGRGLCDELITRPEESYRLCCVVVCDLETSRMGTPYIYIFIYDISRLRVKEIIQTTCTVQQWEPVTYYFCLFTINV